MIHVKVRRGSGAKSAERVEAPMLGTAGACSLRGRWVLDQSLSTVDTEISIPMDGSIEDGDVVLAWDMLTGERFRAYVERVRHGQSGAESAPRTTLTLTRPRFGYVPE